MIPEETHKSSKKYNLPPSDFHMALLSEIYHCNCGIFCYSLLRPIVAGRCHQTAEPKTIKHRSLEHGPGYIFFRFQL